MPRLASLLAVGALAATASAQFSLVIPNTPTPMATTEGNSSNAFPWGRGGAGIRIQNIYDSSHFTGQGITYPILINGLRWRLNGAATSLASTQSTGSTVQLSTCPVDQAAVTTSFAGNRGADLTTCFSGVVSWPVAAAVPGPTPFTISTPFSTNFLYDPSLGDLNIETDIPIQTFTGTAVQLDVQTTGSLASRVFLTTGYPSGTPTVALNHGVVVEIDYVPAAGLYPAFTGTPLTGPAGQLVQFTDHSYSSAPGGIVAWQWDFDGDSVIDSTLQNPSFQYNTGGVYTVSLTVTDGLFGSQTMTKPAYIGIDLAAANFTTSFNGLNVQFTDTSTGNPTSWAWDFENDGIVDSNLPSPSHTYPVAGAYNCKLTVANAYSSNSKIVNLGIGIIPVPPFVSTFTGAAATRGFWFQTPTRFSIVSAQVPDESAFGLQNVAIYRLAAAPPVFSATATGGLEFVSTGQPSNAAIPCVISYDAGEFVGVLGACGDASTCRSSYGTPVGPYASSVLGQPTTLTRFGTQFNLVPTQGTSAYWQEPGSNVSRVFLGVSSAVGLQYGAGSPSPYAPAPKLKTTALPILGQNAVLTYTNNDASVIGLVAAGFGRLNLPTPLGTLLINGIAFSDVINGGAVLTPGSYTYTFAVPNNPALQGYGPLNWQAASLVVPTGEFALSNATEWWLGL